MPITSSVALNSLITNSFPELINQNLLEADEIAEFPLFFWKPKVTENSPQYYISNTPEHLLNDPFFFDDLDDTMKVKSSIKADSFKNLKFCFRDPDILNFYSCLGRFYSKLKVKFDYFCPVLTMAEQSLGQNQTVEFDVECSPKYGDMNSSISFKEILEFICETNVNNNPLVKIVSSHPSKIEPNFLDVFGNSTDVLLPLDFKTKQKLQVNFTSGTYDPNEDYFIELQFLVTIDGEEQIKTCGRLIVSVSKDNAATKLAVYVGNVSENTVEFTQFTTPSSMTVFPVGWNASNIQELITYLNGIFKQSSIDLDVLQYPLRISNEHLDTPQDDPEPDPFKIDLPADSTISDITREIRSALGSALPALPAPQSNSFFHYTDNQNVVHQYRTNKCNLAPLFIWPGLLYEDSEHTDYTTPALANLGRYIIIGKPSSVKAWRYVVAHELGHFFGLDHPFFRLDDPTNEVNVKLIAKYWGDVLNKVPNPAAEVERIRLKLKNGNFLDEAFFSTFVQLNFEDRSINNWVERVVYCLSQIDKFATKNLMDYTNKKTDDSSVIDVFEDSALSQIGNDPTLIEINFAQQQMIRFLRGLG